MTLVMWAWAQPTFTPFLRTQASTPSRESSSQWPTACYKLPFMRIYNRKECLEASVRVFLFFTGFVTGAPTKDDLETVEKCAGPGHGQKSVGELARIVINEAA
jgi:hypothetical protein